LNISIGEEDHGPFSDIDLVKKASRAFAVCYVNEIYNTIKSMNPSLLKKIKITNGYPYSLHLFIHQEKRGEVKRLEIFSEPKYNADGLCEVADIYHDSEFDTTYIEEKKKYLSKNCMNWHLSSLEINKMYTMAKSAGQRVGKSMCRYSRFCSEDSFRRHLYTSSHYCPRTYSQA